MLRGPRQPPGSAGGAAAVAIMAVPVLRGRHASFDVLSNGTEKNSAKMVPLYAGATQAAYLTSFAPDPT
jgi:hypothetical protein